MSNAVLENLHRSLLDSLRQREQNILQFIAILGPALGGYVWLVARLRDKNDTASFFIGTTGIIIFLLVGVLYSIALGFSFRVFQLQLRKLENHFEIHNHLLVAWQKSTICYKPPEVIKVFMCSFLITILAITVTSICICCGNIKLQAGVLTVGVVSVLTALLTCVLYKRKFQAICEDEEHEKYQNRHISLRHLLVGGIASLFIAMLTGDSANTFNKGNRRTPAE